MKIVKREIKFGSILYICSLLLFLCKHFMFISFVKKKHYKKQRCTQKKTIPRWNLCKCISFRVVCHVKSIRYCFFLTKNVALDIHKRFVWKSACIFENEKQNRRFRAFSPIFLLKLRTKKVMLPLRAEKIPERFISPHKRKTEREMIYELNVYYSNRWQKRRP